MSRPNKYLLSGAIAFALFVSSAFAGYHTDKELKIGDTWDDDTVSCVVKAQFDLGGGSEPLLDSLGYHACKLVYEANLKDGQYPMALTNGPRGQIVNCLLCVDSSKKADQ